MKNSLFALAVMIAFECNAHTNWNGQYYSSHSEMQFLMAVETMKQIDFPPQAKILDVGSGNGRVTKQLATIAPECQIIGLDRSSSMLEKAKEYASDQVSFIQGDATEIPFKEQFDRVVSFNCLHWVKEIDTALQGIHDALVPGGKACILLAPVQARYPIHRIINSVAKQDRYHSHFGNVSNVFTLYTFAEWANLIEEADMIPEKVQLLDCRLDYPNAKAFGDWLAGWVPRGTMTDSLYGEYIDDVVNAYVAAIPCEADGTVHLYIDELIIVASKK